MKTQLQEYVGLYALMVLCGISVLLKAVSYGLYHRLLFDSNQMGTTDNRWMKSMMSKFEAYYKLHISVHNVENFVDRYLYRYRFLGVSLQSWENIGYYFSAVLAAGSAMMCLLAGYYGFSAEWFWVNGIVTLLLFCVQGASELFFDTHKCLQMFRIQLIDYMENTMRARLENEYFHQEEAEKYQMEYFEAPKENGGTGDGDAEITNAAPALEEMRELLGAFREELRLDRDIAGRAQSLSAQAAEEKARLFEEILEEYI